jgi:toxin ParE1/3/4
VKVKFTLSAGRQFLEGLDFIRQDNPDAAERVQEKVGAALRGLEKFPESGRRIPEFPDISHREVIVRPYRFFYKIIKGTVWIVAVWHGAQLPGPPELNDEFVN